MILKRLVQMVLGGSGASTFIAGIFLTSSFSFASNSIGLQNDAFLQSIPYSGGDHSFQSSLDLNLNDQFALSWIRGKADLEASLQLTPEPSNWYVTGRELYLSTPGSRYSVAIGRKLNSWSSMDQEWNMGIWQPRFRVDYLDSYPVGLTGLFFSAKFSHFQWDLFASPLFAPDQNPGFEMKDGKCTSSSAWFSCPKPVQVIIERPTQVEYDLKKPTISSVIFRESFSTRIRAGKEKGWYGAVSYGYLPVNQFVVKFDAKLDTSRAGIAEVKLLPELVNHHVGNLEAGWNSQRLRGWAGVLTDVPQRRNSDPDLTSTQLTNATSIATGVHVDVIPHQPQVLETSLSYLHVIGGKLGCAGEFCPAEGGSPFEERYSFRDALSFRVQGKVPGIRDQRLSLFGKISHDFSTTGNWLGFGARYQPVLPLQLEVGADFLSSQKNSSDFVSQYRGNDRVRGGITYVF